MRTDRATFTFNVSSWHARIYRYWQRNSLANLKNNRAIEKKRRLDLDWADDEMKDDLAPLYKENFCHYCRIVLFWGPLCFLLKAPEDSDIKWWVPFVVPLPILGLAAIVANFPDVVAWTLTFLAALAGIATFLFFASENNEKFEGVLDFVFTPLGWVIDAGNRAKEAIKRTVIKTGPFWRWLAEREIFGIWWTRAWMPVAIALIAIAVWLLPVSGFDFLKLLGQAALGIALVGLSLVAGTYLKDWIDDKGDKPVLEKPVQKAKFAYAFLAAKKHRICPLIELEGDTV